MRPHVLAFARSCQDCANGGSRFGIQGWHGGLSRQLRWWYLRQCVRPDICFGRIPHGNGTSHYQTLHELVNGTVADRGRAGGGAVSYAGAARAVTAASAGTAVVGKDTSANGGVQGAHGYFVPCTYQMPYGMSSEFVVVVVFWI